MESNDFDLPEQPCIVRRAVGVPESKLILQSQSPEAAALAREWGVLEDSGLVGSIEQKELVMCVALFLQTIQQQFCGSSRLLFIAQVLSDETAQAWSCSNVMALLENNTAFGVLHTTVKDPKNFAALNNIRSTILWCLTGLTSPNVEQIDAGIEHYMEADRSEQDLVSSRLNSLSSDDMLTDSPRIRP